MCNSSEFLSMEQVFVDIKPTFSDFDKDFYDPEVYIKFSNLGLNVTLDTEKFLPIKKNFVLDYKKMVREFTENTFFPT
jgi:hypothetical protein